MTFSTETYGKWILAGEHAVIRGAPALVFPLKSRTLKLSYESSPQSLSLTLSGNNGRELEPLFWAVLERACDLMRVPKAHLTGRLHLDSSIPIGAGLGASAAFCVAMTRWFQAGGWLKTADLYEFARTLENLFHGESSGVDIAVAMSGEGLHFERAGRNFALVPRWQPKWYISFTGQRGVTSEAVQKVKRLHQENPSLGAELDRRMSAAVNDCERALAVPADEGQRLLIAAMNVANDCFKAWGLSEGAVGDHLGELTAAGAVAVKPTGSGGGGYVLSLWSDEPPASLKDRLIPCF